MTVAAPGASPKAVVAAVVLLVLITTAVFVLGTTHPGAATPEGAVLDLVDALEAGDVVGVLESISPSEQGVMVDGFDSLADGFTGAGVLSGDGSGLAGLVPGVEIDVDGLVLRTSELDDQVVFVEAVSGTVVVRVDAAAVPDPAARAALERQADVRLDDGVEWRRDLSRSPVVFGVVDEGGGYHVSVAYTAAEQVRRAGGVPLPDVETRPDAVGSNTPEEVVTDLFSALEARFPLRVAELVSPFDGRALYDYATAWLPGPQQAADRAGADEDAGRPSWRLRVDALDVSVVEGDAGSSADGPGVRRVRVDRLDATLVDGYAGEQVRVEVGGDGCTTWTHADLGPGPTPVVRRVCPGVGWTDGDGVRVDPPPVSLVDVLTLDGLAGPPTFTVVEREGRWFLSPTRTVIDSLVDGLDDAGAAGAGEWGARLVALVGRAADGPVSVRPASPASVSGPATGSGG